MIVVTGSPRTGTSLAMQSLNLLGVLIVGARYLPEYGPEELYPYGHWDLPSKETDNGITDNRYKGRGIKLFPPQLSMTAPKLITKLIICRRKKEDVLKSFSHSLNVINGTDKDHQRFADSMYNICYNMIDRFVSRNKDIKSATMFYDEIKKDPQKEIEKLRDFLQTNHSIDNAVQNVRV